MAVYYLAAYVGSGSEEDPYRPSGADLDGEWASIDFRPPGSAEGHAIVVLPDRPRSSPQRLLLGDDLDGLTATVRRSIENRLGVDLSTASSVRQVIADLLIRHGNDARKDRWNQLKAEHDGFHRIYLRGLIHEVPVLRATSLADSMIRANNTDINVGAPVTWGQNNANYQISSNIAKNAVASTGQTRAESDLATANHFAQGTLFLVTSVAGAAGPCVRYNPANFERYQTTVQQNSQGYSIQKRDIGNAITVLVTKTTAITPTSGKVLRLEVTGSSLTSLLDPSGSNDTQTATDTAITGNLRTGFYAGLTGGGTLRQGISLWSAGDLGPATVNATLSATLGALTATATAVPKVNATLAATLGGLTATATAKVTEPATLNAPLGGLSAVATAVPTHPATLAAPLGGLSASATAVPTEPATLSAPLGALTATAAGTPTEPATLAAPLGALTAAAAGTVTPGTSTVDATLAAPLGALTATAGAVVQEPATLAAPLGALTAAATAGVTHPATLDAPLGALTAGTAATVSIPAVFHAALGALVATATAALIHPATLNAPLGPLQAQATAVLQKAAVLTAVLGALNAHATAHATSSARDITISAELVASTWAAALVASTWTADTCPSPWNAEVTL